MRFILSRWGTQTVNEYQFIAVETLLSFLQQKSFDRWRSCVFHVLFLCTFNVKRSLSEIFTLWRCIRHKDNFTFIFTVYSVCNEEAARIQFSALYTIAVTLHCSGCLYISVPRLNGWMVPCRVIEQTRDLRLKPRFLVAWTHCIIKQWTVLHLWVK
jgi:hypothetical protein